MQKITKLGLNKNLGTEVKHLVITLENYIFYKSSIITFCLYKSSQCTMYFLVCSRLFYPTTVEIVHNNNNNYNNIISDSGGADWTGPHTFQAGTLQPQEIIFGRWRIQSSERYKICQKKIKVTKNLNLYLLSYSSRSFFFYVIKLPLNKGHISISQQETSRQITKVIDNSKSCTFLPSFYFFIWKMKDMD